MPKMKTHKGCAKRFKATAKGKILRNSSHDAHKFSAKSALSLIHIFSSLPQLVCCGRDERDFICQRRVLYGAL